MSRVREIAQRIARPAAPVALGLIAAWLAMAVWGASDTWTGPFKVRIDTRFGRGETEIVLPPFGHLTADTHLAPLHLQATLLDLRIPELSKAITEGRLDELVQGIERDAESALRLQAIRVLIAVAVVALVLGLAVFRHRSRRVVATVLTAVLAVGGSQVLAIATYRTQAFSAPRYSGTLALAARVIPPATTAAEGFQEQLKRVVDGAVEAYTSIQTSPVGGEGEIRVLHISDMHLSPFGFEFAKEIAQGFDVDFVIDTGDLTSWGTPPENFVLQDVADFQRPYVWVRGNHDGRGLQRSLARLSNVEVLDGSEALLHGIRIYGLGDPVDPEVTRALPDDVFAERVRSVDDRVLSDVGSGPPVDIVAVHDDRMAESVAGRVPLVLSGHFHDNVASVVDGTLYLRVGTTGGSAFGTFETQEGIPLSAEVLYFEPGTPPSLIAYDLIEQSPKTGTLSVTRHVIADEFGRLTPSPSPSPSPTETPSMSGSRSGSASASRSA